MRDTRVKSLLVILLLGVIMLTLVFLFNDSGLAQEKSIASPGATTEIRQKINSEIKEFGGQNAYKKIKEKLPTKYVEAHNNLHIFGEEMYKIEGVKSIQVCDALFGYGCIHGFSSQAIAASGIDILAKLNLSVAKI